MEQREEIPNLFGFSQIVTEEDDDEEVKVARTIADLDNSESVKMQHIAEAVGYRNLDRGDLSER